MRSRDDVVETIIMLSMLRISRRKPTTLVLYHILVLNLKFYLPCNIFLFAHS